MLLAGRATCFSENEELCLGRAVLGWCGVGSLEDAAAAGRQ